jgi:deoxyribodipyrimidine photo-lyase
MIHPERIRHLNDRKEQRGRYVLYWMQSSQRISWNHALQYAVKEANSRDIPLVVLFTLVPAFPEASPGHYRFMLEGLLATRQRMAEGGIRFILRRGSAQEIVPELAGEAAVVVTDRDYLRPQQQWRMEVAGKVPCRMTEVESNVVVPVETATSKEEWSAATFRRKISTLWEGFLEDPGGERPGASSLPLDLDEGIEGRIDDLLAGVAPESPGRKILPWRGGEDMAHAMLDRFIDERLGNYPRERNDPTVKATSDLSPYLHFGQISPVEVAVRVRGTGSPGARVFLEELIVRRELSMNFVRYNPRYDSFDGLPAWTKKTLSDHARDLREYTYSPEDFENATTHDRYWNAAQTEMVLTGKMHGYLRMYWGKKILEWSETPAEGYRIALSLNNRYELDGRDPNGYAGVAWCFGKHDRPWPERRIFGKVRYMNAAGLKRKFDADRYVAMVEDLKASGGR